MCVTTTRTRLHITPFSEMSKLGSDKKHLSCLLPACHHCDKNIVATLAFTRDAKKTTRCPRTMIWCWTEKCWPATCIQIIICAHGWIFNKYRLTCNAKHHIIFFEDTLYFVYHFTELPYKEFCAALSTLFIFVGSILFRILKLQLLVIMLHPSSPKHNDKPDTEEWIDKFGKLF